jgi:hypothetical protein
MPGLLLRIIFTQAWCMMGMIFWVLRSVVTWHYKVVSDYKRIKPTATASVSVISSRNFSLYSTTQYTQLPQEELETQQQSFSVLCSMFYNPDSRVRVKRISSILQNKHRAQSMAFSLVLEHSSTITFSFPAKVNNNIHGYHVFSVTRRRAQIERQIYVIFKRTIIQYTGLEKYTLTPHVFSMSRYELGSWAIMSGDFYCTSTRTKSAWIIFDFEYSLL